MNRARPLFKARSANATSSGFTAKSAAVFRGTPAGDPDAMPNTNCIRLAGTGGRLSSWLRVFPYGLGSNDNTFDMRIWGWNRIVSAGAPLFFPFILGQFSCTLSSFTGVAGSPLLATELPCDTISITALIGEATMTADTTRAGSTWLYTPANNTPAWVQLRLWGAEFIEFDFDQTAGTPEMNALCQLFDDDDD